MIAVFVGTRPEAIKMAPVIRALHESATLRPLVISTGQHREMLAQVTERFDIAVDVNLDIMRPNQTLASLTAAVIGEASAALEAAQPAMTLVQGDTTTVLGATLASFYLGIPVAHLEAGLRTGNMRSPFPEEANRVLVGRIAELHFAPTETAASALRRESVSPKGIHVTGNTVIDALHYEVALQEQPDERERLRRAFRAHSPLDLESCQYVLITGHRRENFGSGFEQICAAIARLAEAYPETHFVYPVHLNPNVQGPVYETLGSRPNVHLLPPLPYDLFVWMMSNSHLVLTDSGGVQEEAPSLAKPVLVMRDTTERPEGVDAGTVKLVGANEAAIVDGVSTLLDDAATYDSMARAENPYGDGHAAGRVARILEAYCS